MEMDKMINILLIEDDEIDVMNVMRAFKKLHVHNPVHVAPNGVEALNLLRGKGTEKLTSLPRIILLDLNMPKMGGLEFLKELRSDPALKSISVFVMTTSNQDNDKIEAYNLNVAGYILKPLSVEKFMQAVSTLNSYWQLCEF